MKFVLMEMLHENPNISHLGTSVETRGNLHVQQFFSFKFHKSR